MATGAEPVRVEDIAGVRSRISWQAVLAGAITAFIGGWVTARLTASETEREAILYGNWPRSSPFR